MISRRSISMVLSTTLLVSMLLLVGCLELEEKQQPRQAAYELTKHDLFLQNGWTSDDVSVLGVQLGDTMDDVIDKAGYPDIRTDYPNSTNFEYGDSLTLNSTGLLINFNADNEVQRMTLRSPFNRFLQGTTKIGHSKEKLFARFGNPDRAALFSKLTVYSYDDIGLDLHLSSKKQVGFSLYRANRT